MIFFSLIITPNLIGFFSVFFLKLLYFIQWHFFQLFTIFYRIFKYKILSSYLHPSCYIIFFFCMRILLSELFSIYSCLNLFFLSFLNSYCIEKNIFGCAQHFFPMIGPLRPLHITCAEIKKKMSMQNNKRNSDQKIIKRRSQALKDGYRTQSAGPPHQPSQRNS